jgi:two-component system, cell cycle sensor histidine kinase and response regulator CckA
VAGRGVPQINPSLNAIDQTVQRGAALVRQILTFARKTDFQPEYVDLKNLLQEIVNMLKETFPRTIRFRLETDPALKPLLGDVSQLHQTFLNLCVNARDAMPNGGTISISLRSVSAPPVLKSSSGEFAEITVQDTGMGMDEATRKRIFEPFFTTKIRDGGTGLGLAVVYGIVNHHGGAIEVDSNPGQGTSFRLYLPLPAEVPAKAASSPEQSGLQTAGTERILFVEDEELLLELMKELLQEQGYKVIPARDGLEAVDIFGKRHEEIDLVVTDIGLPGLGGWEVFLRIREIEREAKVLLASGYLEPEIKNKLLRAGATDLIQKPFVPSELFQKIRRALDESPSSVSTGI